MAEKALLLQRQMMQAATAQRDVLDDLTKWEEEVRLKDEQLRRAKEVTEDLPAVRGSQKKKVDRKKKPAGGNTKGKEPNADKADGEGKKAKLKSYDYRAWDKYVKYDIDKEVAALDKKDTQEGVDEADDAEENDSDGDSDLTKELKLRELLATQEKENGNAQFKKGKYQAAISCYTRGLEHNPNHHVLLSNRAMCFLKMKKFKEAEDDCTLCITLDSSFAKAYMRRGLARNSLNKPKEAIKDFEKVLKFLPKNKQALKEIEWAKKMIETNKKTFNPLEALAQSKSTKPFRRIKIEEIGNSSDESDGEEDEEQSGSEKTITTTESSNSTVRITEVSDRTNPKTENNPLEVPSKSLLIEQMNDKPDSKADGEQMNGRPDSKADGEQSLADSKADGEQSVAENAFVKNVGENDLPIAASKPEREPESKKEANKRISKKPAQHENKTNELRCPNTLAEFHRQWVPLLKRGDSYGLSLLKLISPEKLPKVFKHNMEPEMLSDILRIIADRNDGESSVDFMAALIKLPRFDTMVMFLDDKDVTHVKKIISMNQNGDPATLKKIAGTFRVVQ